MINKTAMKKIFPTECPSCGSELRVRSLFCTECGTTVSGDYPLHVILKLPPESQAFILDFVKCSGSLKEMASLMSLSYPTVRNKLDEIITSIKKLEQDGQAL